MARQYFVIGRDKDETHPQIVKYGNKITYSTREEAEDIARRSKEEGYVEVRVVDNTKRIILQKREDTEEERIPNEVLRA